MYFSCIELFFILFVSGSIAISPKTSSVFNNYERCNLSDPAINSCLKKALTKSFPYMAKGVPSLKLFPYDPMKISLIEINHDNNRAVQVNLKVKDVETINMLSSTEITDFKVDVKNFSASISLFMKGPVLQKGTYYVNGKILALPIVGNGPFSLKIEDINAYIKLYMKKIVKNKKEYLKPENISWNYSNKRLSIKMDNLFNGNKALGDNMNVFMNENWPELGKDFQPALEQVLVSALFEYTSQFFGRVSMEELFIE